MRGFKGFKRFIAMATASMLLCGFACQAAGGSGEEAEAKPQNVHIHAYSWIKAECTYTVFENRHRYVVSTTTKPSGEVVYEYAYCDVVMHYYHDLYRCGCGDSYYDKTYSVRRHMSCGQ